MFSILFALSVLPAIADLRVATDFEGASARVLSVDSTTQTIRFMPGGDPARGWPCWWYFRVDGLNPEKELTVELTGSDAVMPQDGDYKGKRLPGGWAMPERATWSTNGTAWMQTPVGRKRDDGVSYRLKVASPSLWLAWGPPFTPKDAAALVARTTNAHSFARAFELCRSREGRRVPALHIREGDLPDAQRAGVWVHARQHAWEAGSSWVCRGFVGWLVSNHERARWLRQHAEVFVVPIMDIDNAATGNGGKDALPQDHNRDWTDAPHWPEVAAAQRHVLDLARGQRLDLFIDLHNPGYNDKQLEFFVAPTNLLSVAAVERRQKFLAAARAEITGPIPLKAAPRITGPAYHPLWRQISGAWVNTHGNAQTVALTLETPWNTAASTTEGYLAVGRQLGLAVERFLGENPPTPSP